MKKRIILASSSPRRESLLRQTGLEFEVMASNAKEDVSPSLPPRRFVEKLAAKKALEVAGRTKGGIVIGADTILVCKGTKLGKPKDGKRAFGMLKLISGKKVDVYSGVAVIGPTGKKALDSEKATITIRELTDGEIREYIRTNEPLDKAGAIAIQGIGAKFISGVNGNASTVIGLPLGCLRKSLRIFGVRVPNPERWKK